MEPCPKLLKLESGQGKKLHCGFIILLQNTMSLVV